MLGEPVVNSRGKPDEPAFADKADEPAMRRGKPWRSRIRSSVWGGLKSYDHRKTSRVRGRSLSGLPTTRSHDHVKLDNLRRSRWIS